MAIGPVQYTPEVNPSGQAPDRYLRVSKEPPNYGPGIGQGLQALGTGTMAAADFYNKAAADDAALQYQEGVNKILYGDPNEKGPDGNPIPGFMGLQGRAAMEAEPEVRKKIDTLRQTLGAKLHTPKSALQFDDYTRRYKAITDAEVGRHAERATRVYATGVNKATAKLAMDEISANFDDPVKMQAATQRLIGARVKQAELDGGGAEQVEAAYRSALQDGLEAQVRAMAVTNPARALDVLEKNRDVAGAGYDNLYNAIRGRAYQQRGVALADGMISNAPPPAGDDTLAVLRHFEGYRDSAYEDKSPGAPTAYRTGYGSDTVTRADGKIETVTPGTRVTKEDAERDLARRAAISAKQVREAIGEDAWNKLGSRGQASLTSVAYNYGRFPGELIIPAQSGDKKQLADAVRSLSRHNNGINTRRRYSEAANIDGDATQLPGSQADMIAEIQAKKLDPVEEASAINRITQSFAARQQTAARERTAFESRVKDSVAEALNIGQTSDPIPRDDFIRLHGPDKGAMLYDAYESDLVFGSQYKAMQDASGGDVEKQLIAAEANLRPGTPGYAKRVDNMNRLRKAASALLEQRRDDPAGAVARMPAVQEAIAQYDPQKPETYRYVAEAMLGAQDILGIEDEFRSPITKKMALELTRPLKTMLPGEEAQVLTQIGERFKTMFGDEADRAFAYAIRAQKVDAQTAQKAARVASKLALGVPVTNTEAFDADLVRDVQAAEAAVWGGRGGTLSDRQVFDRGPNPLPLGQRAAPLRVIGNPGELAPGASFEPSGGVDRPTPSSAAIKSLLSGELPPARFDFLYGTGRAKEILQSMGATREKPSGR